MIGRKELRQAFGHKPFVTKGDVKEAMGYATYNEVRAFFHGLPHLGRKYLTEDVIDRMVGSVEYDDDDEL